MNNEIHLTLAVQIFERLAAEAKAANIPSDELARQFIATRYEADLLSNQDLIREGEAALCESTDAYGRIELNLVKVFTTAERRAILEENLLIVGNAIALLRELLDLAQSLCPRLACRTRRGSPRRRRPNAANDDLPGA